MDYYDPKPGTAAKVTNPPSFSMSPSRMYCTRPPPEECPMIMTFLECFDRMCPIARVTSRARACFAEPLSVDILQAKVQKTYKSRTWTSILVYTKLHGPGEKERSRSIHSKRRIGGN